MNAVQNYPNPHTGNVNWLQIYSHMLTVRVVVLAMLYCAKQTVSKKGEGPDEIQINVPANSTVLDVVPETAQRLTEKGWEPLTSFSGIEAKYLISPEFNPKQSSKKQGFNGPIIEWKEGEMEFTLHQDKLDDRTWRILAHTG